MRGSNTSRDFVADIPDMQMQHGHMQIASTNGWMAELSGRRVQESHCRPSVAAALLTPLAGLVLMVLKPSL